MWRMFVNTLIYGYSYRNETFWDHAINPLECRGNYSAASNNMKLVHWPLMGGLLHLVQRGGAWAGCGPAQLCTDSNGWSVRCAHVYVAMERQTLKNPKNSTNSLLTPSVTPVHT